MSGVVARVVGWLRAGYPTGVPEHDYVPLLGIQLVAQPMHTQPVNAPPG